jgi:hypothetical protein
VASTARSANRPTERRKGRHAGCLPNLAGWTWTIGQIPSCAAADSSRAPIPGSTTRNSTADTRESAAYPTRMLLSHRGEGRRELQLDGDPAPTDQQQVWIMRRPIDVSVWKTDGERGRAYLRGGSIKDVPVSPARCGRHSISCAHLSFCHNAVERSERPARSGQPHPGRADVVSIARLELRRRKVAPYRRQPRARDPEAITPRTR